jgi:hypothetical protein
MAAMEVDEATKKYFANTCLLRFFGNSIVIEEDAHTLLTKLTTFKTKSISERERKKERKRGRERGGREGGRDV